MKTFKSLSYVVSALLVTSSAYAALTGSLTISGAVAAATAIVVNQTTGYNSLDLSTTAVDQEVATVREINNTTNGYTVTLSSANAGLLKNGTLGSVTYTAKYNDTSVSLTVAPVTITTGAASNSVVNVLKPFEISFTGVAASTLMVGTYSDTLTFTIAAN